MSTRHPYSIRSKKWLIVLSSLAITILFALPRLAMLRFSQFNPQFEYTLPDFFVRSLYSFLIALLFFAINLETGQVRLGFFKINFNRFTQVLVTNVILLILVDFLLLGIHLYLFEPFFNERLFRFLFNINIILEVILIFLVSRIYRLIFYNQQMQMANERLLKSNAETRYELLKNQVNPHFLFNSFNTINSLIQNDANAALQFVGNLSDVFRYVLTSHKTDLVRLEEEIRFIDVYAQMLKGRYGIKIRFEIQVKPQHLNLQLPPMALQVLVENAVKHNVASSRKPLDIHIFTQDDQTVTVSNTLQEKKMAEPSTGLGLSNLNQRCKYLSNKEIKIQRTATTFSVTIFLIP